jgi:hypothetical protein
MISPTRVAATLIEVSLRGRGSNHAVSPIFVHRLAIPKQLAIVARMTRLVDLPEDILFDSYPGLWAGYQQPAAQRALYVR